MTHIAYLQCISHREKCIVHSVLSNRNMHLDNSPALPDSLPDFERGFRPACEVKTGTFDPRTTFGRPWASRSSLISSGLTSDAPFPLLHQISGNIFHIAGQNKFSIICIGNIIFILDFLHFICSNEDDVCILRVLCKLSV